MTAIPFSSFISLAAETHLRENVFILQSSYLVWSYLMHPPMYNYIATSRYIFLRTCIS